ncbi:MAG: histidine phosphatase family protein [Methylococcales bacterium]|jgi:alpha-ribazole phosphatase|nr:histidine phosphatase family protein [Methylococcales bacterium]
MRLDWLRHGEPDGGSKYRGHSIDDSLTERGWQQMWRGVGRECHWQAVVSSPMVRCVSFAGAIASRYDLSLEVIDDLKEIGFGSWEGKTKAQLLEECADEYHAFYHDPVNSRPAESENLVSFMQRVSRAFESIISRYEGQDVLVVTHAGVIRAALCQVVFAEPKGMYQVKVSNGKLTRFEMSEYGISLISHGLTLG